MSWIRSVLKPREGWFSFWLLLAAVMMLPLSLRAGEWAQGDDLLIAATLASLFVGLVFARLRVPSILALPLDFILGVGFSFAAVAKLVPPPIEIWRELEHLYLWLNSALFDRIYPDYPFVKMGEEIWLRALGFAYRLSWWYQAGMAGKVSRDNDIFLLCLSTVVWLVSFYASWRLYRSRRVLGALLPLGVLLSSNVYFLAQPLTYLITYMACVLLLLLIMNAQALQEMWERRRIDYASEVQLESIMLGVVMGGLTMAVGFFAPVLMSGHLSTIFWNQFDRPWGRVEAAINRMFVRLPSRPSVLGYTTTSGGVPTGGHELGGAVEPQEDVVFYVRTDEPALLQEEAGEPIGLKRYWRGMTYDRYTGHGWENSVMETRALEPNMLIAPEKPKVRRVKQWFEGVAPDQELLLGINEPVFIDHLASVRYRSSGDVAAIFGSHREYMVISQVAEPTMADLRAASQRYPDWVREYLRVTPALPLRVRKLAEDITRGATTPYDKARAIEAYLRTFDYTLEIQEPPKDRDVVDYFLFDLKKAYCDYFSTAMVVLARSVGVPARAAYGYSTGSYDGYQGQYVVRRSDAHSWVEVYFPSYGWIEFEPTPYRSTFERAIPTGALEEAADTPPGAGPRWREWSFSLDLPYLRRTLLGLGMVAALGLVWGWRRQRLGGLPPREFTEMAYERVVGSAERAGFASQPAQTPYEYALSLIQSLQEKAQGAPLFGRWPRWKTEEIREDVATLARAYVRARYSPHSITEAQKEELAEVWSRLRRRLFFVRLRRGKGR